MRFLCLLVALVAVEAATTARDCTVSEWGDWQERLPRDDRTGKSFKVAAGGEDVGKIKRLENMKFKTELAEKRRQCKSDGSCPHLNQRASEGFIPCVDGFIASTTTAPLPCSNINQMSFMNFEDLLSVSSADGNDCWGWTDPLDSSEYAIMMMSTGTTFVDISNPSSPIAVAFLPANGNPSTWRDAKVVNDWVFVVSEAAGHGIQAFDLTTLRTTTAGSIVDPNYVLGDVGNCHNIIANPEKNKIYAVGCTGGTHCADRGGLYTVDVTNPAVPIIPSTGVNCYDDDGYVHDAQCLTYGGPDARYFGHDICFCYNEDTFTIVDMEQANNMTILSRTGYSGSSYTHQGWLTEDHTVCLLDDETDEQSTDGHLRTYMWDVTDLRDPVLMNTYYHGIQSIDHNQYVVGGLTYQADYASGLRIYQINQGAFTLDIMGYFDVYPALDAAIFEGSWSVYPYFASGNIVISSINYGMYVVEYTEGAVPKESTVERTRYRSIMNFGNGDCPNLQQSEWI